MQRKGAKGFMPRQQPIYRDLVARAWLEHADREGINLEADAQYEEWYRGALMESIGVASTRDANHVEDFEKACLHFAEIANDSKAISYFSAAVERRIYYWLKRRMDDLTRLEGRKVDWSYCRAIYKHMDLPLELDEAPASLLRKVLQALDTQVRRVHKKTVAGVEHAA